MSAVSPPVIDAMPIITYDAVMAWLRADHKRRWADHEPPRKFDMNDPGGCLIAKYLRDQAKFYGVAPYMILVRQHAAWMNYSKYAIEEKLANFVWLLTENDTMTAEEILLTVGEL